MVDEEGGVTERRLDLVVVRELGQGEPFRLVGLVMVDEYAQVLLNLLVYPLCLPICLRVVCCGRIALDAHQLVKVLHEPGLELGTSVMDDLLGNAVQPENVVSVDFCHAMCRQGCLGGDDMYLLGESIHHHADGIVP